MHDTNLYSPCDPRGLITSCLHNRGTDHPAGVMRILENQEIMQMLGASNPLAGLIIIAILDH